VITTGVDTAQLAPTGVIVTVPGAIATTVVPLIVATEELELVSPVGAV
jgi:hypothetical protein